MTSLRLQLAALSLTLTVLLPSAAAAADRWTPLGPYGGPVTDLAVAPSDTRVVYAATESGVYRSDNAGVRWRAVRRGLPSFIEAVAVDLVSARTVYAGAGNNVPGDAPSIYKSTDGGATWTPMGLRGESISDLAVDPHDPSRLLAAAAGGLFLSHDSGEMWVQVNPRPGPIAPLYENVAFDPVTPGVAYAASANLGVFKSTDDGETWTAKNQGLPGAALWQLGVSPAGVLYVTPIGSSAVYRSQDKAESWSLLGTLPEVLVQAFGFSGETVFAGTTHGIFRKDENGPGWTAVRPEHREDIRAFATNPNDEETLYAGIGFYGGFRGVLKSVDGGATWRPSNQGLAGNPVAAGAIAPSNPDVLYLSLAPWVVARSANGGATWRDVTPAGAETRLLELAVDPRNANVVYAVGEYGQFWRSANGGRSWTLDPVEDGDCVSPTSLTLDPRNPDRLLLAGVKAVGCVHGGEESCLNLESTDRGRTWSCLEGARDASYFSLIADPRRPGTLWAGGVGGVFESTDGGASWTSSGTAIPGDVMAVAAARNGTLWAGGLSVFKSRNGGATWRRSGSGLPERAQVRELAVAPSNPSILYASLLLFDVPAQDYATDLYVSTDGGASWRRLPERGLPAFGFPGFSPLLVDPRDPGRIYVGTPLGLYRLDGATE
jgi:photosystem II stability/assembly factor-like uncharacterized protein